MASLLFALGFSFALLAASAFAQAHVTRARRAKLQGLELKPNCLLTRYPIVFLAGPKSVFRLTDHWNEIPLYLREHGYEVRVIAGGHGRTSAAILRGLELLSTRSHLIADSSSETELRQLAEKTHPLIASLTLVKNGVASAAASQVTVHDLKPSAIPIEVFSLAVPQTDFARNWQNGLSRFLLAFHNRFFSRSRVDDVETATALTRVPWRIEERFLELAIALAENDAQVADTPRGGER